MTATIDTTTRCYAGIGSRRTPAAMLVVCEQIAHALAQRGWRLRTGHAPGADQAFERGAGTLADVFLPGRLSSRQPRSSATRTSTPPRGRSTSHRTTTRTGQPAPRPPRPARPQLPPGPRPDTRPARRVRGLLDPRRLARRQWAGHRRHRPSAAALRRIPRARLQPRAPRAPPPHPRPARPPLKTSGRASSGVVDVDGAWPERPWRPGRAVQGARGGGASVVVGRAALQLCAVSRVVKPMRTPAANRAGYGASLDHRLDFLCSPARRRRACPANHQQSRTRRLRCHAVQVRLMIATRSRPRAARDAPTRPTRRLPLRCTLVENLAEAVPVCRRGRPENPQGHADPRGGVT